MNQNLDKRLQDWLSKLADDWAMLIDQVAMSIGADEIHNRLKNYPNLSSVLTNPVLELDKINNAARNCWALGGRYDLIRFGNFTTKGEAAGAAIERLVRAFPANDTEAIMRIDRFVEQAQLTPRSPGVCRVVKNPPLQQITMKVRHQRTDIPERERLTRILRIHSLQPLREASHP